MIWLSGDYVTALLSTRCRCQSRDTVLVVCRDTAAVVIRVITARATQKLLMQLGELDVHVASWLSNYVSEHKPLGGQQGAHMVSRDGADRSGANGVMCCPELRMCTRNSSK